MNQQGDVVKTAINVLLVVVSIILIIPTILIMTSFGSKPGDGLYQIKTTVAEVFFGGVSTDTYQRYKR